MVWAEVGARQGLARAEMERRGVTGLVVTEGGRLRGILTRRDVMDEPDPAVPVSEIMTRDPVISRDSDTLAVALHKMSVGGFRHIPLLAEGRDAAVVSIQDLFRHISHFIPQRAP